MTLSEALEVAQRELPKAGYPAMFMQLDHEERLPGGGWQLAYRLPLASDLVIVALNQVGEITSIRRATNALGG